MIVAQSGLTFCNPLDCSLPNSSVLGILQARILKQVAISSPGDLPNPGIESVPLSSPALAGEFLPLGKPILGHALLPNTQNKLM